MLATIPAAVPSLCPIPHLIYHSTRAQCVVQPGSASKSNRVRERFRDIANILYRVPGIVMAEVIAVRIPPLTLKPERIDQIRWAVEDIRIKIWPTASKPQRVLVDDRPSNGE